MMIATTTMTVIINDCNINHNNSVGSNINIILILIIILKIIKLIPEITIKVIK